MIYVGIPKTFVTYCAFFKIEINILNGSLWVVFVLIPIPNLQNFQTEPKPTFKWNGLFPTIIINMMNSQTDNVPEGVSIFESIFSQQP